MILHILNPRQKCLHSGPTVCIGRVFEHSLFSEALWTSSLWWCCIYVHTSYLSFLLHRQDFRTPNFTPKKTTKVTKNAKNVSEKVIYMHFFSLILEKITPHRKFLHRHVCGVCEKYEVWLVFHGFRSVFILFHGSKMVFHFSR